MDTTDTSTRFTLWNRAERPAAPRGNEGRYPADRQPARNTALPRGIVRINLEFVRNRYAVRTC